MDGFINAERGEPLVNPVGESVDAVCQPILEKGAHDVKRQPENQSHDGNENGECREAPGQKFIDFPTSGVFLTFMGFDDGLVAESADKEKAHVGDGSGPIEFPFVFHLLHDVFDHLAFVGIELQFLPYEGISFNQFGGSETERNLRLGGMILYEVHDAVQCPVNRTAVVVLIAKIIRGRCFAMLRNVHRVRDEFIDPLIFQGGNRNDRDF